LQARLHQLGADHDRHRGADDEHHEGEQQVQRADVLVVRRKEPALDEALLVLVGVVVDGVVVGHGLTSVMQMRKESLRSGAGPYFATGSAETAFCSASHLRYSAFGSARTTIGMKPWSLPHNSAHWPRYTPGSATSAQASLTMPGMASCFQ